MALRGFVGDFDVGGASQPVWEEYERGLVERRIDSGDRHKVVVAPMENPGRHRMPRTGNLIPNSLPSFFTTTTPTFHPYQQLAHIPIYPYTSTSGPSRNVSSTASQISNLNLLIEAITESVTRSQGLVEGLNPFLPLHVSTTRDYIS